MFTHGWRAFARTIRTEAHTVSASAFQLRDDRNLDRLVQTAHDAEPCTTHTTSAKQFSFDRSAPIKQDRIKQDRKGKRTSFVRVPVKADDWLLAEPAKQFVAP
jgi:hypothetical protein